MNFGYVCVVVLGVILAAIPSALGRKCYVCDSRSQMGCSDANQISQLYSDCSTQQFGGYQQQPGIGGVNPQQPGFQGQYGGGAYGSAGGDRCSKITIVQPQGPPQIIRQCGVPPVMGGGAGFVGSDGCSWNGNIQTCTCEWNYCNGSSKLPSSVLLTIFMTFFTSYILRSALL